MSQPLLVGPLVESAPHDLQRGTLPGIVTFGPPGSGAMLELDAAARWPDVLARWPHEEPPRFLVVWLAYSAIPGWVWTAPVPVIGLAADWNLLGHTLRAQARHCDRIVTDSAGVRAMHACGFAHAVPGRLYGWPDDGVDATPDAERDIDVLFIGNVHPAVQRERLPWLGRLLGLADRFRIRIETGVFGADYRSALSRAKVVFNRSVRGECNLRVGEAIRAGALLLQEAGNEEVRSLLRPGEEFWEYDTHNFEAVVERAVRDDAARNETVARASQQRDRLAFRSEWDRWVADWEACLPELQGRVEARLRTGWHFEDLAHLALGGGSSDPLRAAAGPEPTPIQALQLAAHTASPEAALVWSRRAAAGSGAVAALVHAQVLASLGRSDEAQSHALQALARLEAESTSWRTELEVPPWPPGFSAARVEWEAAGWDPDRGALRKRELVRWQAHRLLAQLTGDLGHFRAAALAWPSNPETRAELGCALGRIGRSWEALPHLHAAVDANPFDRAAAVALAQALTDAGEADARQRFNRLQQCFHRGAPDMIPAEAWFAPRADERLTSIIVLCCNELAYTALCLESVLAHTQRPYELILVDNGSTDSTPAYLAAMARRPGPVRWIVERSETNLGYPAGVNRGLARATGDFVVLLNNDTVVTPDWLDGLVRTADEAGVGLVGAVTNYAGGQQQVDRGYPDLGGLNSFAAWRRHTFAGQRIDASRLSGFCLLLTRSALESIGSLDEQFGLGFFDDDDLSVRALQAGWKLRIAADVFIHHFGSRTFAGLGIDTSRQLDDNFVRFRDKWGETAVRGYRRADGQPLPEAPPATQRVSLCVIARNEEANIAACLNSVRDLVDEVVVVDTGSTDRTRDIALSLGAKVVEFPWIDHFAAARNETLRHATGDWIFWMDADDRVDAENRTRLKNLFANLRNEAAAYVMKCICVADRPGGTATAVDHIRLFRRDDRVRWRFRVHEQILPALREVQTDVRWSEVAIHHVGYVEPALRQKKLARDSRLLELELAEHPDDPFAHFNLGAVLNEQGRAAEALGHLERSLAHSHPRDSIVRKLYAMIAQCHMQLNDTAKSLATIRHGRTLYPDDAELLFLEAGLRREAGEFAEAERLYHRLIQGREAEHFASVDTGLRGYKARHNLALLYAQQKRVREAEALWRAALVEEPAFRPALHGLGELALTTRDSSAVQRLQRDWSSLGEAGELESLALQARWHLAHEEWALARSVLAPAVERLPNAVNLRVLLSHAWLKEGGHEVEAEAVLRDILRLAPQHAEARHNLEVLLKTQGRWLAGIEDQPG